VTGEIQASHLIFKDGQIVIPVTLMLHMSSLIIVRSEVLLMSVIKIIFFSCVTPVICYRLLRIITEFW
jgi:hypothetical protein